ncbi:MAG: hypothetical protein LAQ69_17525 [Acidobacteriia bacterium]|nr:hypothetical protein [Terriglobia bacterium]
MAQPLSIADLEKMFHRIRELKPDWKSGNVDRGTRTLSVEGRTVNGFHIVLRRSGGRGSENLYLYVQDNNGEGTVCDQSFAKNFPRYDHQTITSFPDEDRYNPLDSFLEELHKEAEHLAQEQEEAQNRKGEAAQRRFFSD